MSKRNQSTLWRVIGMFIAIVLSYGMAQSLSDPHNTLIGFIGVVSYFTGIMVADSNQ